MYGPICRALPNDVELVSVWGIVQLLLAVLGKACPVSDPSFILVGLSRSCFAVGQGCGFLIQRYGWLCGQAAPIAQTALEDKPLGLQFFNGCGGSRVHKLFYFMEGR